MSHRGSSDERLTRFDRWTGILGLLFGALSGPVFMLVMQATAYAGVQWACGHRNIIPVHVVPATFSLLTSVALWMSWRDWGAVGRTARAELGTTIDRTRFVALSGVILSGFSLVLILWMWVPLIVFDPCQR